MQADARAESTAHLETIIQGIRQTKMVTVLVTSFLLLAAISYAIYCWQRASSEENAERALETTPPPARGLFAEETEASLRESLKEAEAAAADERAEAILARARAGDKAALREAHETGSAALYDQTLAALTKRADNYKKLLALVSFITRSSESLPINKSLAERFIEEWRQSAERRSVAIALHIAAMTDDASVYQKAVETVRELWLDGALTDVSGEELRVLFDGEYWVLSASARSSGAGFILKRRLSALRHELSKTNAQSADA